MSDHVGSPHPLAPADSPDRRLLSVPDAALYLGGITERALFRMIANGVLPTVRVNGLRRTLVDRRDLDALIARSKTAPVAVATIEREPILETAG